jgi:hypothetical protein
MGGGLQMGQSPDQGALSLEVHSALKHTDRCNLRRSMADWEAIDTPVTTVYHTEEDSNLMYRRENPKPHKESLALSSQ